MSTNGDVGAQSRVITKVVLTYHTADDPTERKLTMQHGGRGEVVDGIVWGEELMKKIAYLEGDRCVEPKKERGTGDWKVYYVRRKPWRWIGKIFSAFGTKQTLALQTTDTKGVEGDCVWVHDIDCMWWQYCTE